MNLNLGHELTAWILRLDYSPVDCVAILAPRLWNAIFDLVLAFFGSVVIIEGMGKKFLLKLLTMSVVTVQIPVMAAVSKLDSARDSFQKGEYAKAHSQLNDIPLTEQDPKRLALIEFFRGRIFFEQKNYNFAIRHLDQAIQLGTRLEDIANYYRGLSYLNLANNKAALAAFEKVESMRTSDYLRGQSQFQRGEILFAMQKYPEANEIYKKLEKKMRNTENYSGILWALLRINNFNKKRLDACYWGRKLYESHPTFEPIAHWGLSWSENLVDGSPLGCKDTLGDQKARIKRLQWMGASEKAFEELKVFEKGTATQFTKDMAMSEYLVNEGMVTEAFNRLKAYYKDKEKRKDYEYVELFAKAASRAGEYQAAVGIHMDAYKKFTGFRSQNSLYRAAFLSYQHQDYDGALRNFEKLKQIYPYTSQGKQANWYIPWLHYLKGNFQKSYDLMSAAVKDRKTMLPNSITNEKVKYWMAMCMKNLGNKEVAQQLFLEVSHDSYMGYYSIAAVQRLKGLIGKRALASIEHNQALNLRENWIPHFSPDDIEIGDNELAQTSIEKTNDSYFLEWEKLPFMSEYLDLNKSTQIYSTMSEPDFRTHIERANELSMLGMSDLVKWELYSIEGRTRNKEYLKTLMFEYHRNNIFHRSSFIGTQHFASLRSHLGLHIGASLWHFVYPRAYEDEVIKSGKEFRVQPEFVWSIMKAETNYRPDALSPVGARGLMQVMTHTGRKVASLIGKEIKGPDLFRPPVSIEIGTSYLNRVLKKFNGRVPLAAAAYNGGPHRVHQWLHQFGNLDMDEFIEHIPFLETRNYVKKVTQYYALYNLLYNKNAEASSWLAESVNVFPEGTPPTKETWEAL